MKTCVKCDIRKEARAFARNGAETHAHCKRCQSEISKVHYQSNKKAYISRISAKQIELRTWLVALKTKPCMDCDILFKPWQMDFDHRDHLMKSMEISKMVNKCMPKAVILAEISKCDLVCSNCHRDRTYKRGLVYTQYKPKPRIVTPPRMKAAPAVCIDCGVVVYVGSKRCHRCHNSSRIIWPSVEQLLTELTSMTFEALGRKLKVSGSAVRKHLLMRAVSRDVLKSLGRQACTRLRNREMENDLADPARGSGSTPPSSADEMP